jgi:PAS domain S-box-containing protein
MTVSGFQFDCLLDARLAPHAASPNPVWLWSIDGSRILWANPTGAAIFGAASPADLGSMSFDTIHPARAQIARLADTLANTGAGRLERLRGFGARFGGLLTCTCSRIDLPPHGAAILVVSAERAGPDLSLAENARRLLAHNTSPVIAYDAEGKLLVAAPEAAGDATVKDLNTIGATQVVNDALKAGAASGSTDAGRLSLARIGEGNNIILLATIDAPAKPQTVPAIPAGAVAALAPATAQTKASDGKAPLRFVWQIDDAQRFTLESPEFIKLIGPVTAALFNRPWPDLATMLHLDPTGAVKQSLEAQATFSGLIVPWPVDGSNETLPVELSGLPVFDRERQFRGYRGFGICRDVARLDALALARDLLPPAPVSHTVTTPASHPPRQEPHKEPQNEPQKEPPAFKTAPVLVQPSTNVMPFPAAPAPVASPIPAAAQDNAPPPTLSPVEKLAFRELARRLGDGLRQSANKLPASDDAETAPAPAAEPAATAAEANAPRGHSETPILDRVPFGILVYRLNDLLYANKAFLDWTGYSTLYELMQAGGLDTLFIGNGDGAPGQNGTPLTISTQSGGRVPVEGRLFSSSWDGENALVLMVNITAPVAAAPVTPVTAGTDPRLKETELALHRAESTARELETILNTATDGVVVLDRDGRILSANHSAQALFGYEEKDFISFLFGDLFAPESRRPALDYLDRLGSAGTAMLINEGREVIGRVRQGGLLPLFMTLGRVGGDSQKFCAVFRDVTAWKKTEEELLVAKRRAETTSTEKSEFLAKISHEMRSPLNAIIGFSEVMIGERFGPIGSERYRDYLKDIHASGEHLIALLNDLLDLSRIETGKLDLTFASLNLNDLTQQCVAVLQPQANRGRVIIRTAFADSLPPVVADARAVRQIVLNLLSSSLKMTDAGGQVIVSTAVTDDGDIALRVRDSGAGMSAQELAHALDPFRELSTTPRWGASGTGLGLPITKALAEANHATFHISSAADTGTLIEVVFPATRVLAE